MSASIAELEQELEAPAEVLALVRSAARGLGASPELAAEAARTGVFELQSRRVSVAVAPDETALLLTTDLSEAWGCDPAFRIQALRASTALLLQAGVVFCQTMAGPALICRWRLGQADADLLAAWIREFALMGNVMDAGASAAPIGATKEI
jgi:hypothetical protein